MLFRSTGDLVCLLGKTVRRDNANTEGNRVLVVQLGDIGDLVLTSPFLRELGKTVEAEGGELVLVVKPSVLPIAERCPYASRVVSFDARRSRLAGALSGVLRARRFAQTDLSGEYSSAWNPRFDLDELGATFVMLWSGAARRISFSEEVVPSKALRNHGYDCLLTEAIAPRPGGSRHEVDRLLELLKAGGVPASNRSLELWLSPEDEGPAGDALAGIGARRPVALGVGAGHPKRCWPGERFAQVAERLYEDHDAIAVLAGSPPERPLAQAIERECRMPLIDAVGRLSIRQTAALIGRCTLYVGNDSGLLHIAAAAGIPAIEVSCHPRGGDPEHPNAPERWGPYGVPSALLQPPPASGDCVNGCDATTAHCIEGVSVDEVMDEVAGMLREPERTSR